VAGRHTGRQADTTNIYTARQAHTHTQRHAYINTKHTERQAGREDIQSAIQCRPTGNNTYRRAYTHRGMHTHTGSQEYTQTKPHTEHTHIHTAIQRDRQTD